MTEHRVPNGRSSDRLSNKLLMGVWPMFVAVVLVAIAWGTMQSEIKNQQKDIDRHCERDDKVTAEHAERLARIEEAIKAIPEIQKDVKAILGNQKELIRYVR